MPTQKIDPKIIFASNAPAIDKPPVFSDKTKGMDVTRRNDGRPEIKELNKLFQDTDLKILWLNENAVLPYDETIDYPDGVVTLKDGSFKQLLSGSWVEFLDDFADKDAVKRGIANRYDSSLTYNSGERVVLANGDIVKSTTDGNANDPNVDMTGWVKTNDASQIFDESGKNQQEINDITNERLNRGSSDLLDFIPKSQWVSILNKTSITDVSSYIDQWLAYGKTSGKVLTAPTGLFIVSKIHLIDSVSVVANGMGKTEFKLKDNVSSTVAGAFDLFRLTGDNPTAEKFTVDGNRANQSWEPIGSANYGLASINATGSPFVRDVETKNVTANGLGHPVGSDPTKWINCRSHGNGKKGFHSGAVFGSLILGGEYFNNELDQGIGMHQGINGGRIYLAKIYNNGLYGVSLGSTVNTANIAKHNEIAGCEMWGHSTCDIFIASNNSLTDPADPATVCHANIHDNDLRSDYAIRGRFARFVTVHDNQIHGGRMEFQNPLSTYVRGNTFINCPSDFAIKAEGISGKTGDDFHTIGNIFNGTSCTSPIVISGVTRYKTRGNEFNFSGTVNYPVRIYDNLDTAVINETALVRLNTFNAQFGVNDFLGIRHIKSNAKPTVTGGFKIGDICYSTNPNTSGVMGWVFDGTLWNGLGLRADKITGLSSASTTADVVAALKAAGFAS